MITSTRIAQLANAMLRLASLGAKLVFTIYMSRYLTLSDMGAYGLVFGAVMVLSSVIGIRFDYVVSRELIGMTPQMALAKMRDQTVFYTLNNLVLFLMVGLLAITGVTGLGLDLLFFIAVLGALESYGNMTYLNMISLGRPLFANSVFFIRSGLWAFIVMLCGILIPSTRNINFVFILWIIGVSSSLLGAVVVWRHMPWAAAMQMPVDWRAIRTGVARTWWIWLGTIGVTGGFYIDRFVTEHYLGLDAAGIITFYASFATASYTLIQSGVLAFAYPRFIALYNAQDLPGFHREVRQATWHVALSSGLLGLALSIAVPWLGRLVHRPELAEHAPTFWLMLAGVWIRSNAETAYYVLYARHQDRPVWLGNLLFLIPAFGANAIFIPLFGLNGVGISTILASSLLLLWRLYYVKNGKYALHGVTNDAALAKS